MAGVRKRHILTRHVAPLVPVALSLLSMVTPSPKPKGPSPPALAALPAAEICDGVADFHDCHSRFPTGCNTSGNYDAYLNFLKNQLISPPLATTSLQFLSQADFQNLDQAVPPDLKKSNHADFKDQLANNGEGKVFGLIGFLNDVIAEGSESSNCQLTSDDPEDSNGDYHIYIGFDPAVAAKLRSKQPLTKEEKKALKQTGVIVEMTPHERFAFGNGVWTIEALKQALGSQVRVTGQLLVDSEHNVKGQNCALGLTASCWRASVWELHPVTGFQVCKDNTNACAPASSAWAELGSSGP